MIYLSLQVLFVHAALRTEFITSDRPSVSSLGTFIDIKDFFFTHSMKTRRFW